MQPCTGVRHVYTQSRLDLIGGQNSGGCHEARDYKACTVAGTTWHVVSRTNLLANDDARRVFFRTLEKSHARANCASAVRDQIAQRLVATAPLLARSACSPEERDQRLQTICRTAMALLGKCGDWCLRRLGYRSSLNRKSSRNEPGIMCRYVSAHQHYDRPCRNRAGRCFDRLFISRLQDVVRAVPARVDDAPPLVPVFFLNHERQRFPVRVDHDVQVGITLRGTVQTHRKTMRMVGQIRNGTDAVPPHIWNQLIAGKSRPSWLAPAASHGSAMSRSRAMCGSALMALTTVGSFQSIDPSEDRVKIDARRSKKAQRHVAPVVPSARIVLKYRQ